MSAREWCHGIGDLDSAIWYLLVISCHAPIYNTREVIKSNKPYHFSGVYTLVAMKLLLCIFLTVIEEQIDAIAKKRNISFEEAKVSCSIEGKV